MTTPSVNNRALIRRLVTAPIYLLLLLTLTLPATSFAQEADALFRGFEPYGDLAATLDGKELKGSQVFVANRAGSYLLIAPQLEQVILINARITQVDGIAKDKVRTNDDRTVDVLADASFEKIGAFEIQGEEVLIPIPNGALRLIPTPALLGLQTAQGLIDFNASYGFKAEKYPPSADDLAKLKKEKRDVQVRVYFGSWCSTCSRIVPWIIRVDQELAGSSLNFEYYGLPRTMDDPKAEAMDIHGVPTMLVLLDGKEVGRLGAEDLAVPEKALLGVLAKTP